MEPLNPPVADISRGMQVYSRACNDQTQSIQPSSTCNAPSRSSADRQKKAIVILTLAALTDERTCYYRGPRQQLEELASTA